MACAQGRLQEIRAMTSIHGFRATATLNGQTYFLHSRTTACLVLDVLEHIPAHEPRQFCVFTGIT